MLTFYLSHTGMTEPLGHRQVLPYLRGLSQGGVRIELFACEPAGTPDALIDRLQLDLLKEGISYTPLRRRPSHGIGDKLLDSGHLLLGALQRVFARGVRPRIVHARSHLPGAVADALTRLSPDTRFVFDCRGLLAEEYVDLGHWRRGSLRYRLTSWAESRLFRHADRIVVLTEALRRELHGEPRLADHDIVVIPCCVDTDKFQPNPVARAKKRAELGLSESARLVVFAGALSRYDLVATAGVMAEIRRCGDARLLLVTQDDPGPLLLALDQAGCGDIVHTIAADPHEVPDWLAASDLAVSLLRECRSSIAASPTKVAEALASGLPTLVSKNVAENNRLEGPGVIVLSGGPDGLGRAAEALLARLRDPAQARAEARATALRQFALSTVGIARYRALYEQLS